MYKKIKICPFFFNRKKNITTYINQVPIENLSEYRSFLCYTTLLLAEKAAKAVRRNFHVRKKIRFCVVVEFSLSIIAGMMYVQHGLIVYIYYYSVVIFLIAHVILNSECASRKKKVKRGVRIFHILECVCRFLLTLHK